MLLFLVACAGCAEPAPLLPEDAGTSLEPTTTAIQGGGPERGYRSVVAVYLANSVRVVCSGVLIAPNVVATNAHCLTDELRAEAAAGYAYVVADRGFHAVAALETHPEYVPATGESYEQFAAFAANDLAVLYLATEMPDTPVASVRAYTRPACNLKIVGYGFDSDLGPYRNGVRRSAYVCATQLAPFFGMIPARRGGGVACLSDSGGGVFVTDGTEQTLVALMTGSENARANGGMCGDGRMFATPVARHDAFLVAARRKGPRFLRR